LAQKRLLTPWLVTFTGIFNDLQILERKVVMKVIRSINHPDSYISWNKHWTGPSLNGDWPIGSGDKDIATFPNNFQALEFLRQEWTEVDDEECEITVDQMEIVTYPVEDRGIDGVTKLLMHCDGTDEDDVCSTCSYNDGYVDKCPNNGGCPMCSEEDIKTCPKCGHKYCWFCGGLVE